MSRNAESVDFVVGMVDRQSRLQLCEDLKRLSGQLTDMSEKAKNVLGKDCPEYDTVLNAWSDIVRRWSETQAKKADVRQDG